MNSGRRRDWHSRKGCPLTELAFDDDIAAQQTCKVSADRQPQSGSTELARGRPINLPELLEYVIDGLVVKRVGELNFSVVRRFVDQIVTVPDERIFAALLWTMAYCKVVPEGAAAASVAALLEGKLDAPPGTKVACVLSGGNLGLEQLEGLTWN